MWMMTTIGFFSTVEAEGRPGYVMVRARRKKDLSDLLKRFARDERIRRTPKADYLFRIVVPTEVWARWTGELAEDAEGYPNFKNAVAKCNVARSKTYAKVWNACLEIEREGR